MKTIKLKFSEPVPNDYTGIVERVNGTKGWFKNGNYHREDGPAYISKDGSKSWCLDGEHIWSSVNKLDLTSQIILSKGKHPEYPNIQVWKVLNLNKVYEQIVISGMEEVIIE